MLLAVWVAVCVVLFVAGVGVDGGVGGVGCDATVWGDDGWR